MIHAATRVGPVLALSLQAIASCSRGANSTPADTTSALRPKADSSASAITLRGTVVSASASELVLKSDSGVVTVKLGHPFRLYARVPSDLSHVRESAFIGVTTVNQPDGSERASEIHIFPEELRGLGEGSRMMAPGTGAAPGNRMTNGNVSASRMTNGTASPSRMSNGSVSSTNGSTLVVQYSGGSQTVTVPPTTPVTELKLTSKQLVAGDRVAVLAKKAPDGSLTADRALSTAR